MIIVFLTFLRFVETSPSEVKIHQVGTSETVKCVGKSEDFPKRKNLHQSLELNHFERGGGEKCFGEYKFSGEKFFDL